METKVMEDKVLKMAKRQGWELIPFEDLNGINEELGEVGREVRRIERGRQRPDEVEPDRDIMVEQLAGEIGDMLFPLIKLASYYGITLERAFNIHIAKLEKLYKDSGEVE
jgi:NTP pyrophosphatase (non-canonical NTP hydrolase)